MPANDIPDWTGQQTVTLLNSQGQALGDPATRVPPADTVTEALLNAPSLGWAAGVLASFKAAAGSLITQVGAFGGVAAGLAGTVTPAFGQNTALGHLLAAWVTTSGAEPTTASAGWVRVADQTAAGSWAALFVKPNSGAIEAAPTFTCASGHITAQLSEWAGVATVTPTDQFATATTATASLALAASASDVAYGDLLLLASIWGVPRLSHPTLAQSWGNQAVGGQAAANMDNGFLNSATLSGFSWAVVPVGGAALPLGVRAWDYDALGTSAPAAGSQASVVLAAVTGKAYRCALIDGSLEQTAATATGVDVQLLDGAAVVYTHILGVPAAIGNSAGYAVSGMAIKGTAGNSMTLRLSAAVAGANERVNIGAYLQ